MLVIGVSSKKWKGRKWFSGKGKGGQEGKEQDREIRFVLIYKGEAAKDTRKMDRQVV